MHLVYERNIAVLIVDVFFFVRCIHVISLLCSRVNL